MEDKPPLGLMPKSVWDTHRLIEIKEAIKRYIDVNKPIPMQWIEEYNDLQR